MSRGLRWVCRPSPWPALRRLALMLALAAMAGFAAWALWAARAGHGLPPDPTASAGGWLAAWHAGPTAAMSTLDASAWWRVGGSGALAVLALILAGSALSSLVQLLAARSGRLYIVLGAESVTLPSAGGVWRAGRLSYADIRQVAIVAMGEQRHLLVQAAGGQWCIPAAWLPGPRAIERLFDALGDRAAAANARR